MRICEQVTYWGCCPIVSISCWEAGVEYIFQGHPLAMDNSQEQVSAAGGWVLWLGKGDLNSAPTESTTSFFPHFCMILKT